MEREGKEGWSRKGRARDGKERCRVKGKAREGSMEKEKNYGEWNEEKKEWNDGEGKEGSSEEGKERKAVKKEWKKMKGFKMDKLFDWCVIVKW